MWSRTSLARCLHPTTVQEEILAREIFGEIARLKHLANFTLTNDIWMYYNSGCVIPYIFCWRFKYWRKIEQIANRQNKVLANKSSCTVYSCERSELSGLFNARIFYIIGASLSEPHLVRTMISLSVYIYIYIYRTYGLLVPSGPPPPVNALRANV